MNQDKIPVRNDWISRHSLSIFLSGLVIILLELVFQQSLIKPQFLTESERYIFYLVQIGSISWLILISALLWIGIFKSTRFILTGLFGLSYDTIRRLPHHQIIGFVWIVFPMTYFLSSQFMARFNNDAMIAFSLSVFQALMMFIACVLISIVTLKSIHNPITRSHDSFMKRLFLNLTNPYLLSALIASYIVYHQYSWLKEVLPMPFLILTGLFGAMSILINFLLKHARTRFHHTTSAITIPAFFYLFMGIVMVFTLNYSQNLRATIFKSTIIPGKTLVFVDKLIPLRSFPAIARVAIEKGEFDSASYYAATFQDYPYDHRPIRDIIGDTSDWNILVLSIDALRADHLSCYGYPFNTTPNIDVLAKEGVLFEWNFIQGGDSPNSINSFMSGISPVNFKRNRTLMLKDILRKQGFKTGFVGYEELFPKNPFREDYDDHVMLEKPYREIWASTTSEELTDEVKKMLNRNKDRRFFIYCHLLDPHAGYVKTPEMEQVEGSPHVLYDGEIAHTDKYIGELFDYLKELDLYDNTLIVITADHGEEHNDHGQRWHGKFLYNESIRVPMIMRLPHIPDRRVQLPVGSVDLVPTILDFLDIEPPESRDGRSLLPLIYHGDYTDLPPVFSMIPSPKFKKYGVIHGPWKLIFNAIQNTFELYNYMSDPAESINLVDQYVNLASVMRDMIADHYGTRVSIPMIHGDGSAETARETKDLPEKDKSAQDSSGKPREHGDNKRREEGEKRANPKQTVGDSVSHETALSGFAYTTFSSLMEPRAAAFAQNGTLIVSDLRNYRVLILDRNLNGLFRFGSQGNKPVQLEDASGIAVAQGKTIVVADTFNHKVKKFDFNGKPVWTSNASFMYPWDVTVDPDDTIWVTNSGKNEIVHLDSSGQRLNTFGKTGSNAGEFLKPIGIAVDTKSNVYVADTGNKRIQVFDGNGIYRYHVQIDGWEPHFFNLPYLCLDDNNHLFVSDPPAHRILVFRTGSDTPPEWIGTYPSDETELNKMFKYPMGLDYCAETKQIVVVDCHNGRLVLVDRDDLVKAAGKNAAQS